MDNPYKPIKHTIQEWHLVKRLATLLSEERGTKVSLASASTEAVKKMLDEKNATINLDGENTVDAPAHTLGL